VDIGPKTIAAFAQVIAGAKTVIWNGPMGIFEKPPFDNGTVALAKAVASSGATSVWAAAIRKRPSKPRA